MVIYSMHPIEFVVDELLEFVNFVKQFTTIYLIILDTTTMVDKVDI